MDNLQVCIDEYLSGNLPKAITLLNQYITDNGYDLGSAYYHLGLCFSDINNIPEACTNFIKAVEYSPNNSMYLYKLGLAYYRLMALDKASEAFLQAIHINPEHQRARFLLGQVYLHQGKIIDAENIFTATLEKSPDFADGYYYRALSRYQSKNEDKAIKDLYKAITINPNHTEAQLELAKIYAKNGDTDKVIVLYKSIYDRGIRMLPFMKLYLNILKKLDKSQEYDLLKYEIDILYPNNLDTDEI